ncbi:MAG: class I SAM-dependent methyltransferase [Candidatus Hodarchaeota archaeon]
MNNAEFWNELCGSSLALSLGIQEISQQSLQRFDEAYFSLYPYLKKYYINEPLTDKKILEVGLGYGTLGQVLAASGGDYYGLDIAVRPVEMMCYRLSNIGYDWRGKVQVGSALDAPYKDSAFDYVYSIGCLHHTGNLEGAISEVHRLLKARGKAIIMLYNKNSFRLLIQVPVMRLFGFLSGRNKYEEVGVNIRALYDTDSDGTAAPHTDFVSPSQARRLFRKFSSLKIDIRNFDSYSFRGKTFLKRENVLDNIGRVLGLDLYIRATK